MSMWEDQQVFEIIFKFSDGTADAYVVSGGGYDRQNMVNPFSSVLYRGDFFEYAGQLFKFANKKIRAKTLQSFGDIVSADLIYQELCSNGYYWAKFHKWTKDGLMEAVSVNSSDTEFVKDAFTESPSAINTRAALFAAEILEKKCRLHTDIFDGDYSSFTIELTYKERMELRKKEFATAFIDHYSSHFCCESDFSFRGKRFVIAEADYPKNQDSQGARAARALANLGAKETKDISSSTDFLLVSTENIQSSDRYILTQGDDGKKVITPNGLGTPKIEKAIEFKRQQGKIKIITLDHLDQVIKSDI